MAAALGYFSEELPSVRIDADLEAALVDAGSGRSITQHASGWFAPHQGRRACHIMVGGAKVCMLTSLGRSRMIFF